jgi:WD40 repeat protein
VQSAAASQSGKIYVSYDDGTIREWVRRGKRKPYSKSLDFPQKTKNIRLIARPENALTLLHEQRLLFFDIKDNSLLKKSAIEVKTNRKLLKSHRDTILMIEEREGGNKLLLIDLEDQAVLRSAIIPPFSICDNLSSRAFVIYHEDIGLRVIDVETKEQKKLTIKNAENISCLTARQLHNSADQFLLAFGQKNGVIQLYKIDLENWAETLFLQHKAHEKTVKNIAFIDDEHIIFGGYDKKLLLLSFDRTGYIKGELQELRISIECRGMKIDGVIRDEERANPSDPQLESLKRGGIFLQ